MIRFLKQIALRLPPRFQQALKRQWFAWKLRAHRFVSEEPEFGRLETFIFAGDWTLDIGANVGYYTARMSEIVGPEGRVLTFEPVRASFELLVANSQLFRFANTTLLNVAVSAQSGIVQMCVPEWQTGGNNYYEAFINEGDEGVPALAISIDSLNIPNRVALAKIDTEGHELAVLRGMQRLIERDHPVLIVEANSDDVATFLKDLGYSVEQGPDSSNYVCCFGLGISNLKE